MLLAAARVLALPAAPASLQEQQPQIRASVDVVRLTVAVEHTAGGAIPPLSVEDFEVLDNGVRQDVRLLLRPEETPLRVALVIDASPSLRPWWLTVQRAAVSFLAKMDDSGCPYVLPFSNGIGPGRWGRYPANDWREFLADAPRGGGTVLHDALVIALDQLESADAMAIEASQPLREGDSPELDSAQAPTSPADEPDEPEESPTDPATLTRTGLLASLRRLVAEIVRETPVTHIGNCDLRYLPEPTAADGGLQLPADESVKAVLLLSDGADTDSVATVTDVINAARLANVPVFPVLLGSASQDRALAALLAEIARATGGLVTDEVAIDELPAAYDRVLGYLRSSYVLVYDPDAATAEAEAPGSSWHEVQVSLRRPLLRAIARAGYYR
jgi:hypothetical protein